MPTRGQMMLRPRWRAVARLIHRRHPVEGQNPDRRLCWVPASAGLTEDCGDPRRRSTANGFTLVELLVVMVILALTSTAVMLAIPDPRGSLRDDGERLAARLGAARDAAIIGGREMAVRFEDGGYGFEMRRGGTWLPADGRAFSAQRWPEGTAVTTEPATTRIIFDATGLATPTLVRLSRGGAAARVTVEAAGAVRIDAG